MKIAVFGCSWSMGILREWSFKQSTAEQQQKIPDIDFVSWPRELGKLRPDWEIHNYSLAGASTLFSVAMLERVLSVHDYDCVIFQVSTSDRYSSWSESIDIEKHLHYVEPNVKMFKLSILDDVILYDSHDVKKYVWNSVPSKQKENEFINFYYFRTTDEMFDLNHKALVSYARSKSDIVFAHRSSKLCASVEETLGLTQFENFFMDQGKHFGLEGCQWQAKWVLDQINTV